MYAFCRPSAEEALQHPFIAPMVESDELNAPISPPISTSDFPTDYRNSISNVLSDPHKAAQAISLLRVEIFDEIKRIQPLNAKPHSVSNSKIAHNNEANHGLETGSTAELDKFSDTKLGVDTNRRGSAACAEVDSGSDTQSCSVVS
eukprot:Platyproteum_vivax@DN12796_c0_g1_i1.p1